MSNDNINSIFFEKYLKYKEKYLELKFQIYGLGSLEHNEKYLTLTNAQFGGKGTRKKKSTIKREINHPTESEVEWDLQNDNYYVGICKLNKEEKEIIQKNPHCAEFFCKFTNILNCTECANYLVQSKLFNMNPFFKKNEKIIAYKQINNKNNSIINKCKNKCVSGYLYDFIPKNWEISNKDINKLEKHVDKYKILDNFYNKKFIYNYAEIPNVIKYEETSPKPKSVVHWGQLKLFLTTLFFLVKYIEQSDQVVHIIYAGSAVGHNILILSDLFPNVKWYLIDPAPFTEELYTHKQVVEIKNEFFTDELAKYYYNLLNSRDKEEKLFFISDIRLDPSDENVIADNESDAKWHEIIKPDLSYLKFRCPYEGEKTYEYYDGEIFIQPYAPIASTESRILLSKNLKKKTYNIHEYQGKFCYFNRVLRPSYYVEQIIKDNNYFDHCYDCTYFSYLMKEYLDKFKDFSKNVFKSDDVLSAMYVIKDKLVELGTDRIKIINDQIRSNIKN
jgi:hypothetical protein